MPLVICIISFNKNVIFLYVRSIYISFTDVIFKRLVCVFLIMLENNVYYNDFFLYFYNLDFSEWTQITLFFFFYLFLINVLFLIGFRMCLWYSSSDFNSLHFAQSLRSVIFIQKKYWTAFYSNRNINPYCRIDNAWVVCVGNIIWNSQLPQRWWINIE